ncbi:UDP-glucoronosyl and UDP-glucosyl transferase [Trichostrongylus colubriformis]|uniref:glucuronosyltransferase n=1 Tax=Trichostrongylus colubriformis TaxID=6319 RepID=A0AAN8EY18_TRICO
MIRCWMIFMAVSLYYTDAYKFLVYNPIFGYSHTNFMGVIADTLTEAGHDVTVLMPVLDKNEANKTGLKLTKKVIKPPLVPRVQEMMKSKSEMLSKMWTVTPSVFALVQLTRNMTAAYGYQCEGLVTDDALLKRLADEKFDVGIAEAFTFCGLGLFEVLNIPSSIATFSGVYTDIVSQSIGEPITPSYVPGGMATQDERMNIVERMKNVIGVIMGQRFFSNTFVEEIKAFRKKFGPEFRDYDDIIADASYVFTNSNPYLDFPRPIIHKTIAIGGVAVHIDSEKNVLTKEWDSILSERNTTVLVAFGSVAKSIYMPDEYK